MTPAATERNRVASLARYYVNRSPDTGPWGGARKCKPGCTCKRHSLTRRRPAAKKCAPDCGCGRHRRTGR